MRVQITVFNDPWELVVLHGSTEQHLSYTKIIYSKYLFAPRSQYIYLESEVHIYPFLCVMFSHEIAGQ